MDKSKQLYINLLIDEEMSDSLLALMSFAQIVLQTNPQLRSELAEYGKGLDKLTDALIDPVHKAGWCKDPKCIWEPKEKQNG